MVGLIAVAKQLVRDKDFRNISIFVVLVVVIGAAFYHEVEGWGWIDSIYFCVTTLTTVGYGDLYPHTDAGKIFTTIYLLMGIGILLGYIKVIADIVFEDKAGLLDMISEKTMTIKKKIDNKIGEDQEISSAIEADSPNLKQNPKAKSKRSKAKGGKKKKSKH